MQRLIGVIPAAGKGTRFQELGKEYPKCCLPYGDKPIIIQNIITLAEMYCYDVRVCVSKTNSVILRKFCEFYSSWFKENHPRLKITFIEQIDKLGLAPAIYSCLQEETLDDYSVAVLLSDLVINKPNLLVLGTHSFITVKQVPDYSRWCMVETNNSVVSKFIDKPAERPDTNLAVSGFYYFHKGSMFTKDLNTVINEGSSETIEGEYQLSSVMELYLKTFLIVTTQTQITDLGTIDEYIQKRPITTTRSFNNVEVHGELVSKSSSKKRGKIINEASWYKQAPNIMQCFTPKIIEERLYGDKHSEYIMERIPHLTLRELFLYADFSLETWEKIFDRVLSIVKELSTILKSGKGEYTNSIVKKTQARYGEVVNILDLSVEDQRLCEEFLGELEDEVHVPDSYMHGDMCFSNILYDLHSNKPYFIDPRGEFVGSYYYDLAKLCHSIFYAYDFIDSGFYIYTNKEFHYYDSGRDEIRNLFRSMLLKHFPNLLIRDLQYITSSLYLSMIPLHNHNKLNQQAIFQEFKKSCGDIYEN